MDGCLSYAYRSYYGFSVMTPVVCYFSTVIGAGRSSAPSLVSFFRLILRFAFISSNNEPHFLDIYRL